MMKSIALHHVQVATAQRTAALLALLLMLLAPALAQQQLLADGSTPTNSCLECSHECDTKASVRTLQDFVSSMPYPEELRATSQTGRVVLRLHLDCQGQVQSYRILSSSHPAFARTIERRLPGLRIAPPTSHGQAQAAWVTVPIDFRLN